MTDDELKEQGLARGSSTDGGGLSTVHALANPDEMGVRPVYYVSDLHIEHHVDLAGKTREEMWEAVRAKADELVGSLGSDGGVIVLLGDVADDPELSMLFHEELVRSIEGTGAFLYAGHAWGNAAKAIPWRVYTVPGNHELWNGELPDGDPTDVLREAFAKEPETCRRLRILQNELVADVAGAYELRVDEQHLLDMDDADLREIVARSTFTMLGGMGFTGLDAVRGAAAGAYGFRDGDAREPRVSPEEDTEQSRRFRALHDKLVRCAGDLPVIVATHTPMRCWSDGRPNPGWVYLHGHTHIDELVRDADGTTVIADNQIGYGTGPWRFKAFTHRCVYDPFDGWDDGVYEVTGAQYAEFNSGRGIFARGKVFGEPSVTMVKREGAYMFFVETPRGLRMLAGGRRYVAAHDLEYYSENLGRYVELVRRAFEPYRRALEGVSNEVRAFGGSGMVHGSIVDVDFFRHIYVNPLDGTVTPYLALNIVEKVAFPSTSAMLAGSPYEARFLAAADGGNVPLLAAADAGGELARVPEMVLDTDMYRSSNVMRAVQYVFEKGVVRIWNDDVLATGDEGPSGRRVGEAPHKALGR